MQQVLKQSTAATTIVGPILDSSGAAYTGASIGDLNITKNGVTAAMAAAATLTHDHNGHYLLALTTGNTDTLGRLDVTCNKSTYAMPPKVFEVLPATVFDALVTNATTAAGGLGDIQRMAGTALTARDIGASVLLSSGTGTGQVKLSAGYVAPNWGDVGSPSTAVNLSATTVNLVNTITTYTGDTPQTGDAYARLGAPAGASVSADIATTNGRLTSARAGYLDKLNVSGNVASQADVLALNQSASRRVVLTTVGQYERPESGSTAYTVEARLYDGDGSPADADSTPTLDCVGSVSGSLNANKTGPTSPEVGVYRWTYTVEPADTPEQVRFDIAFAMSAVPFTLSAYTQVADFVAATWTTTDRANLEAVAGCVSGTTVLADVVKVVGDATYAAGLGAAGLEFNDSGRFPADLGAILSAGLTQGGTGRLAGAFSTLFNVAAPVLTTASVNQTGDSFARLGAPAGASVSADVAAVAAKTTNLPASPAAVGSAMTLTSGERDSIAAALLDLASGVESGKTLRQALRLMAAALAGKRSNAGTATEQYDAIGSPGTARIVGNLDAAGDGTPTLTP